MKQATLKYKYTTRDGERMIYLCRVGMAPRTPLRLINQDVKQQIEKEKGSITDFELIALNDPIDIAMLDDDSEARDD